MEFGPLTVPCFKKDAHGVGSAATYAKRYSLSAALLIASDEDDDGNAATVKPQAEKLSPAVPKGFPEAFSALVAAARKGEDALRERWKATDEAIRLFITSEKAGEWDQLKQDAKQVAA